VDAIYRQAQLAQAEIVREIADYPWHMRQFWVRHPDGYLIRPAQKILSVNPATYRRQVTDAFERDTPRITQELLAVKQTADRLAAQGDFLGAATIYERPGTTTPTEKSGTFQKRRDWSSSLVSVLKRWATVWRMNGPIG
jgi:hypothetical protein